MPSLKDNLRRWREAAEIDWFSQFIKAWIPFNAWMTDTFGDLNDRELLDRVKGGNNVVFNRAVPMISQRLRAARDAPPGWQDESVAAADFRSQMGELHRLLQSCLLEGRRGRVSFETVDIGSNANKDEQQTKWARQFRVRRDHPQQTQVTIELSGTRTSPAFTLTLPHYSRRDLEDAPTFQALRVEHRSTFLAMFDAVAPRKVTSVLAAHDAADFLTYGDVKFGSDPYKNFSALIDVLYSLRNALFHGSITPNETHNEIYKPAYLIVMRLVQCTI